jgi:hypothetical protein
MVSGKISMKKQEVKMDINAYINRYGKYGPIYGPGFSNHLPMAFYALHAMACGDESMESLSRKYIEERELIETSVSQKVIGSIGDMLGQSDAYTSYLLYFEEEIRKNGMKVVVKKCLDELAKGLGSSLFHAVIRLSFGLTADNEEEVTRALAYLASSYDAVDVDYKTIESNVAGDELFSFIKHHDQYFCLTGTADEKERVLLDALCELYLSTGSFVVLHTITGYEAIVNLRGYFTDYSKALDNYTLNVLRWLKRVTERDIKDILIDREMEFDEMKSLICGISDVHSIKLLYSTEVLFEKFGLDKLKRVARLKLKIDHGL